MKLKLATLIILVAMTVQGCDATQTQQVRESLTQAQSDLHKLQADLAAQQAASTQPNATQPAPPASAVKAVNDLSKRVDQLAAAVQALPQDGNPGDWVKTVAPLTGPASPWVYLAGTLIGVGYGIWQRNNAKNATAAASSVITSIEAAKAGNPVLKAELEKSANVLDAVQTDGAKALVDAHQ